ncbi:MAG TPA: sulfotransferase [Rhodanobacteraceae bacterium]|nr:sulfotransferase [Rhodanobacteraceae bacterium]
MIDQPIFVVGAGRSGSSLFHQMFTEHPQVAWMSTLCDRHPDRLAAHRALMRAIDLPVMGTVLKRRWESAECYGFWDHCFRGFSQPCRDLCAEDATPRAKARLQHAVEGLVTPRRSRLLVKITGWPRVAFLHAVFPDARFIHVYRDGRAVANSLLQVDFWRGWQGPEQWRWGPLDDELRREWEAHDRSFVALAGIQWKILMRAAEAARRAVPAGSFIDVRYEEFAKHPVETFREIADFCKLRCDTGFERALSRYSVESANYKWQQDLDAAQQAVLLSVLGGDLRKYAYD